MPAHRANDKETPPKWRSVTSATLRDHHITLPPKARAVLSGDLVLGLPMSVRCVCLASSAQWEHIFDCLSGTLAGLEGRIVRRFLETNTWDAELDMGGRFALPPKVVSSAGLRNERGSTFIVVGEDHVELWAAEEWQALTDRRSGCRLTERFGL